MKELEKVLWEALNISEDINGLYDIKTVAIRRAWCEVHKENEKNNTEN